MQSVISRRILHIQLETYDVPRIIRHATNKVMFSADLMPGIRRNTNGPVYLPTKFKRWTMNKDVFVHKKAKDQWERRTTRRMIPVTADNPTASRNFKRWVRKMIPPGVGVKITEYSYDALDTYYNATPLMPPDWNPSKDLPDEVESMPDGSKVTLEVAKAIRDDLDWYSREPLKPSEVPDDPLILDQMQDNTKNAVTLHEFMRILNEGTPQDFMGVETMEDFTKMIAPGEDFFGEDWKVKDMYQKGETFQDPKERLDHAIKESEHESEGETWKEARTRERRNWELRQLEREYDMKEVFEEPEEEKPTVKKLEFEKLDSIFSAASLSEDS